MDKERVGYVYKITSNLSGLCYIGIHSSPEFDYGYFGSPVSKTGLKLEYETCFPSKSKRGYKISSYREFQKYFEVEVLEWCFSVEQLHQKETSWIKELDTYENGLNRNYGSGFGSPFGPSYVAYCQECKRETKWKSDSCYDCLHREIREERECEVHGFSVHVGESCVKCCMIKSTESKWCAKCQKETTHRGGTCRACVLSKSTNILSCPVHGETWFMGSKCRKCFSKAAQVMSFCVNCDKKTSHIGEKCRKCSNKKSKNMAHCEAHGVVQHIGKSCYTCASQSSQNTKFCKICDKEVAHRGNRCMACSARNTFEEKHCSFCGISTKQRGDSCMKCESASSHSRWHKSKRSNKCQLCIRADADSQQK